MKTFSQTQLCKIIAVILVQAISVGVGSCGNNSDVPCCQVEVTNPYCVETPDWYEGLTVTAAFDEAEPSLLVVTLEPKNDIVDMNGFVDTKNAGVEFLGFVESHDLVLVLMPDEDATTIVVTGAVDCTTQSKSFVLTLYISSDKSVTFELSFTNDADGGDVDGGDADAGKTDTAK